MSEADAIADEQIAYWRADAFMTAAIACQALGIPRADWRGIKRVIKRRWAAFHHPRVAQQVDAFRRAA